jgi:chromosomal replication initiation ATPase DnaA
MTQLVLPFETRPALGRDDLIVTDANREAVAFADRYPDWPQPSAALHGPAGAGKSHLAAVWAARSGAAVLPISALTPAALDAHALAIEDVDAAPPDAARDALLVALTERGKPLLLTGREAPQHWQASLPDLVSRYRAMLAFPLWAPDDAMLAALARKLFADRQLAVPDAVVARMLSALERSPGAVKEFVRRADERALAQKKPVSLSLIRDLLV